MSQSFIKLPTDATNTGKKIDTQITATALQHREVLCIGDKSTDANIAPVDGTKGLAVDLTATGANATALNVTVGVVGVAATSLGKAEDAPHSSGDTGVMLLGVRNDAGTTLATTTGDYIPLSMDANGALRVAGSTATTQYAEDVPHVSGDQVVALGAIRRDTTPSSSAGTAGDYAIPNLDANGRLYVQAVPYTSAGAEITASSDFTHDVALTPSSTAGPMAVFRATDTSNAAVSAADDAVLGIASLTGKPIVLPYSTPAMTWSYAAVAGGLVSTAGLAAKAAGGAGVRHYVTSAQVMNSHATQSTEVRINDGAGGTALHRGWAQAAGGGFTCRFDPPLRGTAATLVEIAEVTATLITGVLVNLQGYSAAE